MLLTLLTAAAHFLIQLRLTTTIVLLIRCVATAAAQTPPLEQQPGSETRKGKQEKQQNQSKLSHWLALLTNFSNKGLRYSIIASFAWMRK